MATMLDETTVDVSPSKSPSESTVRTFRPDVEGLRAVAVVLVVLYHAGLSWIPGGYVGVDVFFVISGFLITSLLLREFNSDGRIALADFYARRARRILPLASVVLIATVAASSLFLSASRLTGVARDGLWTAIFGANFHFSAVGANYLNATAAPSPLQHFWSLAVEEQFYLLWPALLWLALVISRSASGRFGRAALITGAVVVASFAWSVVQTAHNANTAYFSPLTRGWELGIGALIAISAIWLARMPQLVAALLGWAGLALIAYSAIRFNAQTAFPGSAAAVPVLGAGAVLISGLRSTAGGPQKLLSLGVMQRLGRYSFSLYLWHWPILIIAEGRYPHLSFPAKLVLIALSVGLSAFTYRRFEDPIRRAPALTRSVKASLLVGVVCIASSLVYCNMYVVGSRYEVQQAEQIFKLQNAQSATAGGHLASSLDIQTAVVKASIATASPNAITPPVQVAAKDMSPAYNIGCLVGAPGVTSPTCTFGDPTATRTVVLFGDSHAAQWMPAFQNSASRADFKLVVLTKGNCPAPTLTVYNAELKRAFTECNQWRQWAIKKIASLKPAMVVVSSTFHGAQLTTGPAQSPQVEAAWDAGLTITLRELKSSAGRVVMIGDVASHRQTVPDCVAANINNLKACSDPVQHSILSAHETIEAHTAVQAGVPYFDVRPWFCTATVCPAVINGIITDFDDSHMTETYSKYLGHAVGVALGIEK